jgi:hypothetical protein
MCLVGKTIGDTRRTRVNQNVEDEASRAGAAAGATCSLNTLRGTYLFADNGVFAPTRKPFAGAGYEYYDGNGNLTSQTQKGADSGALIFGIFGA